jgi:NAD(P)-dependent dehydrogenase (short-subunit alcohol dehydrogenase family)
VSVHERKTVLVTGGSRGLGLGIVLDLLGAGYRVGKTAGGTVEKRERPIALLAAMPARGRV